MASQVYDCDSSERHGKQDEALMEISTQPARLTYRRADVCKALGISSRTLDRLRADGLFPPADVTTGGLLLWRVSTIERWLDQQGRSASIDT